MVKYVLEINVDVERWSTSIHNICLLPHPDHRPCPCKTILVLLSIKLPPGEPRTVAIYIYLIMYPLYKYSSSGNPSTKSWIINTLLYILCSTFLFNTSFAQSSEDSDKLDFTQNPDLKNSPSCLSYCLVDCIPIPGAPEKPTGTGCRKAWDPSMGCTTTKCLCSDIERVEGALKRIHSCASLECGSSYKNDSAAGQKLLLDYCSMKGYQFVGNPTSTSTSTLSGLGNTVTATVTVTTTPIVQGSGAHKSMSKPLIWTVGMSTVLIFA